MENNIARLDIELTDEQVAAYLKQVKELGSARQQRHGAADATAFAMGAAVLLFMVGRQADIPSSWVFGPLTGRSPFD